MKKFLLFVAVSTLVLAPACFRRSKTVIIEEDDAVIIERVSGPDGWGLTEEDLK